MFENSEIVNCSVSPGQCYELISPLYFVKKNQELSCARIETWKALKQILSPTGQCVFFIILFSGTGRAQHDETLLSGQLEMIYKTGMPRY